MKESQKIKKQYLSFCPTKLHQFFVLTEFNKFKFIPTDHDLPLDKGILREFLKVI